MFCMFKTVQESKHLFVLGWEGGEKVSFSRCQKGKLKDHAETLYPREGHSLAGKRVIHKAGRESRHCGILQQWFYSWVRRGYQESRMLQVSGRPEDPEPCFSPMNQQIEVFLQRRILCLAFTLFFCSCFALFPRRLDANHISSVPPSCFSGLYSLRHLWLDDNSLTEIPVQAFRSLSALQAMTLALNKIHHIPDYAFRNLSSLVVL